MNETDNGGMTVSTLLLWSLIVSLALPEIALLILGVLKGGTDPAFTYSVVGAALVVEGLILIGTGLVAERLRRAMARRRMSSGVAPPGMPSGPPPSEPGGAAPAAVSRPEEAEPSEVATP